ncbi:MAG TPA: hypothetical protein PLB35_08845 [Myxococcota bacterium]|nr:hypothetical protein [Myxococcota bacterium]HOA13742.1 hypothetical protein [Myxococcota bacterium]HOH77351.1 hypothetical protein [Myxococcota bacterium]
MSNKLSIKSEQPARDNLKGPDEFQQYVAKVADFFRVYGTRIAIAAGAVVVVLIAVVLIGKVMKSSSLKTASEFSENFTKVSAQILPNGSMEGLPVANRQEVDSARKALAEFAGRNEGKEIFGLARIGEGIAALQAGDAAGAADILKAVLDGGKLDPALVAIANEAFAVAADQAGRREDAIKAYELIAAGNGRMSKVYALLHLGDMFNPAMKVSDDQPIDAAKATDYYNRANEAAASISSFEAMMMQGTVKSRIALMQ